MARRPPQTRYAQSTGAKIAYQVSGAGRPDLVMVPGLVSHLDIQWHQTSYRRFVGALERRCRLIRFDKRGTGLSDPTDDLPTTDDRVVDMTAVIDATKSASAVVFGVSDGGRAAIAFAAAHPERVAGLILYGTSYRGPRATLFRRYRSIVRHWGEGRLFDLVAPTAASSEARHDAAAFERAAASPAMAAALVESLGPIDVHEQMSVLAVPTLVLHREGDMIPLEDARRVARQIPRATLTILPGQDHLPWVGDWQPVVEEILGFVDDVVPPRADRGKRGRLSRPGRPSIGWPSLTDAERPVVVLVAQGLSNSEIAKRLFLSRYTVETHLKHVFAKLGVASRAELAALAAHTEDLPPIPDLRDAGPARTGHAGTSGTPVSVPRARGRTTKEVGGMVDMPNTDAKKPAAAEPMTPVKIEHVFDDPLAIRRMVERHRPDPAMASYLPDSALRGTPDTSAEGVLPWFRGTWAAAGEPLVEGAEVILDNPRFIEAASRLFDSADVTPNTVLVNINAPMPAGAVHVDLPFFTGADRDRYPIQLLQAMGSSALFEPWRVVEAGAVFWLYDGAGGAYDYWPEGLDRPMHSEYPPFSNSALVADNNRMHHRIGQVGDPAARLPAISVDAEISHLAGGGWVITDQHKAVTHYSDEQIRISIVWKAKVTFDRLGRDGPTPLTPERIVEILSADLASRSVKAPVAAASPLSDPAWLELVHSTYVIPIDVAS